VRCVVVVVDTNGFWVSRCVVPWITGNVRRVVVSVVVRTAVAVVGRVIPSSLKFNPIGGRYVGPVVDCFRVTKGFLVVVVLVVVVVVVGGGFVTMIRGVGGAVGGASALQLTSHFASHTELPSSTKKENFVLSPRTNFSNPFTSRKLIFFTTLPSSSALAMILFSVIESSWMEIKLLEGDASGVSAEKRSTERGLSAKVAEEDEKWIKVCAFLSISWCVTSPHMMSHHSKHLSCSRKGSEELSEEQSWNSGHRACQAFSSLSSEEDCDCVETRIVVVGRFTARDMHLSRSLSTPMNHLLKCFNSSQSLINQNQSKSTLTSPETLSKRTAVWPKLPT
jgi:hypothetical protein